MLYYYFEQAVACYVAYLYSVSQSTTDVQINESPSVVYLPRQHSPAQSQQ